MQMYNVEAEDRELYPVFFRMLCMEGYMCSYPGSVCGVGGHLSERFSNTTYMGPLSKIFWDVHFLLLAQQKTFNLDFIVPNT